VEGNFNDFKTKCRAHFFEFLKINEESFLLLGIKEMMLDYNAKDDLFNAKKIICSKL
jgi:hypothetical protein